MPFIPTVTILAAVKSRLEAMLLDADTGSERLFGAVEYFNARDANAGFGQILTAPQTRVALIVPGGDSYAATETRCDVRAERTTDFDIVLADTMYSAPQTAGLVGGEENIGIIALKDRVIDALTGASLGIEGVVLVPAEGALLPIESDEFPGRIVWSQSFRTKAGLLQAEIIP